MCGYFLTYTNFFLLYDEAFGAPGLGAAPLAALRALEAKAFCKLPAPWFLLVTPIDLET